MQSEARPALRFGSLFSGIGGFDLGLERAGWESAWQVEIDEDCQRVLERHWPEVPRYGDVKEVQGAELLMRHGPVDLVCGGFPCQDLSVAGRRAGLAGERGRLWFEFRRIADELRPRWVLIENVPGLLSSKRGSDFAVVLGGLAELGYMGAWRVLDARHFGVPQRRRRVFLVGCLGDGRAAAEVLFEREGGSGDLEAGREAGQDIAGTLGGGSGSRGWASDTDRMTFVAAGLTSGGHPASNAPGRHREDDVNLVARALTAHPNGHRLDGESDTFVPQLAPTMPSFNGPRGTATNPQFTDVALVVGGASWPTVTEDMVPPVTGRRADQTAVVAFNVHGETSNGSGALETGVARCLDQQGYSGGRGGAVVTHALTSEGADASEDGTGRGTPLVAQPLRANRWGGSDSHGDQGNVVLAQVSATVRRLLPVECERLQGLPDGWTDGQSDSVRYRQLGNAVAVPVIEWIGGRLAAAVAVGAHQ